MDTYLGVDLGTTGLKVAVINENGELVVSESHEYPIATPKVGWAEQNAEDWWKALAVACTSIERSHPGTLRQVIAISLCGQMHTQVLMDGDGALLRPAITWMDQRSANIVERINQDTAHREMIIANTQNRLTTTYTAAHLSWIQENEPETWERTRHVLVAKDYLKYRLTGQYVTDYSEASGTLLFNNASERWSDEVLRFFNIPQSILPELRESSERIGTVRKEAAQTLHLTPGTPVINGSTDNSAAALGAGMVQVGQAALIIGTAGVVSVCSDHAQPDPHFRTLAWHYCLPKRWINLGVTQTAGESLNWFKEAFDGQRDDASTGDIFSEYNREIASLPDGSDGLTFLPYLNGERTPHWDAAARGTFFGIGLHHRKAHFIRAIMEGVSFALRDAIESVEDLGTTVSSFHAVGGGLKSPVWSTTLARVLSRPIQTVEHPDTGNVGNAVLAAVAMGRYATAEEAVAKMVLTGRTLREEAHPNLEERYGIYRELYRVLRPLFHEARR